MIGNKFNTFQKFLHPCPQPDDFEIDMQQIQPILNHIKEVWCDDDIGIYDYVLKWIASIAQKPFVKNLTALVVVSSREGAGKNSLTDFLSKFVFGRLYVRDVSRVEDLQHRFNDDGAQTLLSICNEIGSGGSMYKTADFMKEMITRETQRVESKGVKAYYCPDYNNYIFTSNNEKWIAKVSSSDRRYCCLRVSNKYVGNSDYFKNLYKYLTEKSGRHFWYYLLSLDLSGFNVRAPPITDLKRDMVMSNYDPFIKMLIRLESYRKRKPNPPDMYKSSELLDIYNQVCEKREQINSTRSFGKRFSNWHCGKIQKNPNTGCRGYIITS